MIDLKLLTSQVISNNASARARADANSANIAANSADIAARQLIEKSSEKIVYTGLLPVIGASAAVDLSAYDLSLYNIYYTVTGVDFVQTALPLVGNLKFYSFNRVTTDTLLTERFLTLSNVAILNNIVKFTVNNRLTRTTDIASGVITYVAAAAGTNIGVTLTIKLVRKAVTI